MMDVIVSFESLFVGEKVVHFTWLVMTLFGKDTRLGRISGTVYCEELRILIKLIMIFASDKSISENRLYSLESLELS